MNTDQIVGFPLGKQNLKSVFEKNKVKGSHIA